MLTPEDIKNLIEAEQAVFATKQDFEELRKDFSRLATGVDAYAHRADGYFIHK